MSQYLYTNKRKSLVNKFLHPNSKQCTIDTDVLYQSFTERWSNGNDAEWEWYDLIHENEQKLVGDEYEAKLSADEVRESLKRIKIDNSAGPDNVTPGALKGFNFNMIMATIFTIISLSLFRNIPQIYEKHERS